MGNEERMAPTEFQRVFRPDHWGVEDTWEEELREQLADPESAWTLHQLVRAFVGGAQQLEPVVVNGDRVHDGHSRTLALGIAGATEIRFVRL